MRRWSEADLNAARMRLHPSRPIQVKRSKYRNVKVHFQGQSFDSKAELAQWQVFEEQKLFGAIRSVVRQVSLPLPGTRRRHRIDFLIVENDGRQRWYDKKGMDTPVGQLKRQQVFDAYGIKIELC
jgi:hypothetical protein